MFVRRLMASSTIVAALASPVTATAAAQQVGLPDVVQSTVTVDGWQLRLTLTELSVNSVPVLGNAPLAAEGFVSARATAVVEGNGTMPVTSGRIVVGVQLGCQVDLSAGLSVGLDPTLDIFNFDEDDDDNTIIGDPTIDLGPSVDFDLHAGAVEEVGLGVKALTGNIASIYVRDAHVEIAECGGQMSMRVYASVKMSTDTSDDSLNAYGAATPF